MTRYIVIVIGKSSIALDRMQSYPAVELYQVDGIDAENQIDMALLNDLVRPLKLTFVGGEEARRFAQLYHGTWIEDGAAAMGDIQRGWDDAE